MSKFKKKKYEYFRSIQREQLGYSANIYFVFSSAILGFVLNLLIEKRSIIICIPLIMLSVATVLILISILFYGLFTHNRLKDFRKTAKYYKEGKSSKEVSELTADIGELTWRFYDFQRLMLLIGFVFTLIGISKYIYL